MIKAWKHLCTILHHKNLVRAGCFKIGLYKQGLLHDMSKYTPTEFLVGCKYYQGTMSPNNAEREDKGYSAAWLHHKGRNKHHMEYWIDYGVGDGRDGQKTHRGICGMKMPILDCLPQIFQSGYVSQTSHYIQYPAFLPGFLLLTQAGFQQKAPVHISATFSFLVLRNTT